MNQKKMHKTIQRHPFHLVDPSPWPILSSFNALGLTLGLVLVMHKYHGGTFCFFFHLIMLVLTMFFWWRDVIREATFEGHHTSYVQLGLKIGMILFIASEIMFFFAFFWAFFHSSLNPSIGIGCQWPPKGIDTLDPWSLPLLNTFILLSSGATVTWAHHSIIFGSFKNAILALSLTVGLGLIFSLVQAYEYLEASYGLTDSVFGSAFYMLTGFHGFHVFVGTLFLFVCLIRLNVGHFTRTHHVGFEAAAWYWHFVDVVWIFVFLFVYVWGGK